MLDVTESVIPGSINTTTIDDRSDADLDGLQFGVIALDPTGIVLRYNLYESRLARLDRNQVIGRNFFSEVAPCTRSETFWGRFQELVMAGTTNAVLKFDFIFDFKFGAQDVSIEMFRALSADRYYLLINRRKVSPPRPEFPRELLAAEQQALAPNEELYGVLRDDLERRFVDAPAALFYAFRATCDRLAPEAWQVFSTEWGVQWGRPAAVDLEAGALETSGRSLREISMSDVARIVATYFAERGFGLPVFDFSPTAEGIIKVELSRSALAEAASPANRANAAKRNDLACHLVAGALSAIMSSIAGRRLIAREVECAQGGAPQCSIVIVSYERRAPVDAVLHAGERGYDAVRLALRRAPRLVESKL